MGAGLTAAGTVAAMVTVALIVAGSVLAPSGAADGSHWKPLRHWRKPARTVTATVTVTANAPKPSPTATITLKLPGPTVTKTVTVVPTSSASSNPTPTQTPSSPASSSPTSTGDLGVGVYMSGNNAGLDDYTSWWKTQPNIASFYLNWNSAIPAKMKEYAAEGRQIQVRLSTKVSAGTYVLWKDVAAGTYDSRITTVVKQLDALGVPVLLSLDSEPDGQYTAGSNAGVAQGQTPAQYVAAANHFADLIHANSTRVKSLLWLAGFRDAATEASFLPKVSKIDHVGWDPYLTGSHSASETATQLFSRFIDNVLVPNGYGSVPRHILETGIKTDAFSNGGSFSTTDQINFYKSIPAAMKNANIETVVWFRSNSGTHDYIPTDSSVDQAFADMLSGLLG